MNHLCCSFRNATEILTGNWVWNDDWPGLSMANLPAAQHWMHPDKVHHHAKSGLQAFKPKILWINGQRCFLKRCKKSYYKTSHQPAKTQNTSPKVTFSKIHRSTKAIKLRMRWCYKIYTTKLAMFSTCHKLQRWSSGFGQHTSHEHPRAGVSAQNTGCTVQGTCGVLLCRASPKGLLASTCPPATGHLSQINLPSHRLLN